MNDIKVSIVIPICNVERYLKECLDSVINQTLKDIEIICVDDGSTDASLSILRTYEKMDTRIKVITKQNSGYGNTMNVGMDIAIGEYIGIVESDDYIEKNMFERLYNTAVQYKTESEQNRCAMACQGCGAVFLLFLKKAVDYFLKSIYC